MSADGLLVWCEPGPDSSRKRLPNRRECFTETIEIGGRRYEAGVGFAADGETREIFLSGPRIGSDMAFILADIAIVVALAMQHGIPAATFAASMSRLAAPGDIHGDLPATQPASVIGVALDLLARYEAEDWR
jgi:ribonucleoside-diphosphate reductase alpha chain